MARLQVDLTAHEFLQRVQLREYNPDAPFLAEHIPTLKSGDTMILEGPTCSGKSHVLLTLLSQAISPRSTGGFEQHVLLIDTDTWPHTVDIVCQLLYDRWAIHNSKLAADDNVSRSTPGASGSGHSAAVMAPTLEGHDVKGKPFTGEKCVEKCWEGHLEVCLSRLHCRRICDFVEFVAFLATLSRRPQQQGADVGLQTPTSAVRPKQFAFIFVDSVSFWQTEKLLELPVAIPGFAESDPDELQARIESDLSEAVLGGDAVRRSTLFAAALSKTRQSHRGAVRLAQSSLRIAERVLQLSRDLANEHGAVLVATSRSPPYGGGGRSALQGGGAATGAFYTSLPDVYSLLSEGYLVEPFGAAALSRAAALSPHVHSSLRGFPQLLSSLSNAHTLDESSSVRWGSRIHMLCVRAALPPVSLAVHTDYASHCFPTYFVVGLPENGTAEGEGGRVPIGSKHTEFKTFFAIFGEMPHVLSVSPPT